MTVESTNGTVSGGTFNTGDQISLSNGNDTLKLTVDGALKASTFTAIPTPSVSGVETVNVRAVATTASSAGVSIDASLLPGVTAINADRAVDAIVITGLAKGASAGVIGDATVANGALTFGYVSGNTSAVLNVSGGTTGTTNSTVTLTRQATQTAATVNNTGTNVLKTLVLNGTDGSSTTASVTGLTINNNGSLDVSTSGVTGFAASAKITATGSGTALKLGTLEASNVLTVDASAFAGAVTTTLNTAITSFKGGQGNDSVTTAATTATGAVIDGGTGTDVLALAATNDITTAAKGAQYINFETLKSSVTSAYDSSLIAGITSVESAAAGAGFSKLSASLAANIKVSATLGSTATAYSLADASGTADVLGLNFANATATTIENATALNVTGFETLNLTVGSGLGSLNKADGTAGTAGTDYSAYAVGTSTTDLKKVTLSGAYAGQVDISGSNTVKVATVDASSNTAGADIVTGGQTVALTVTGTSAYDKITLGTMGTAGSQTINAGAGNDKISGAQADVYAATVNGGDGTDTLTISDTSALTLNDQTFRNVSAIEKVAFSTSALTFTVGGYASTVATGNAGVLDVTAASLKTTAATAIDASGLSGSNSLKLSATVTADAANGANVTVTSSQAGKDSITVATVAATSKTIGNVTIDASANTLLNHNQN